MILSYLETFTTTKFESSLKNYDSVPVPLYTSVDWLTATNTNIGKFHDCIKKFSALLRGVGLTFVDSGHGFNGYTNCWYIQFNGRNCGSISADATNRMGGMLVLSGTGCQLLQTRWDAWQCLMTGLFEFGFNIKRLDVAADFRGALWHEYNCNILHIAKMVKNGLGVVGNGAGKKPKVQLIGDFLDIVVDAVKPGEYYPTIDAPNGCTINIGSSSSSNSWCIYEKGKQMNGKSDLMPYSGIMLNWIRIERRFSQGSGRAKSIIPFDFALYPDKAFVYKCDSMAKFLDDWIQFQEDNGVSPSDNKPDDILLERVSIPNKVSFRKTAQHVASHSARFFRSLMVLKIDPMDFVNRIVHDETTKGFCPDLNGDFTLEGCFGSARVVDPKQIEMHLFGGV